MGSNINNKPPNRKHVIFSSYEGVKPAFLGKTSKMQFEDIKAEKKLLLPNTNKRILPPTNGLKTIQSNNQLQQINEKQKLMSRANLTGSHFFGGQSISDKES